MDPLLRARDSARAQVEALRAAREEIVRASEGSNADDEHDPEGATIAFEREQVSAMLAQAEASVAAADEALARRDAGSYGVCVDCGGDIGAARLEALPSARTCIDCARAGSRSR